MNKILFILDRAHGSNVKGKASPDGTFKEWAYSERVVSVLAKELKKLGIPYARTVDGKFEIGLTNRVLKANQLADGFEKVFLISFHNNAAPPEVSASGIEVFTKREYSKDDEFLANTIMRNLTNDFKEVRLRQEVPNRLFKTANFTVLSGTKKVKSVYASALIEFLFMDNEKDLSFLKDDSVFKRYVDSILYSIVEVCKHYEFGNFLIV